MSLEKMDDLFGVTELIDRKLDAERGESVDHGDNKNSTEQNKQQSEQIQPANAKPSISEVEHKS
jgi:hypothetical protein